MENRVFVSYSHKDAKWANEVVQGLETLGFRVWKDDWYETAHAELESGIAAGADWTSEIEKAIASCQGFVGLVSDNSQKSKWCKKELLWAEQQPGHTNIIICHREDTKLPDGISYAYTDNSHIVWSETDNDSVWSAIVANKEFMAIREGTSTIDEIQSPMVKRINKHLETDWERHRSFLLMKNLDRSLLPTGNFIQNKDRMVVNESDERTPFAEFIRKSWQKQTHLYIEGTGGVGKSVSLLTFATEPGFLPVNVAAVYIPLNRLSDKLYSGTDCIDEFLKRKLADDEFDWIEKHSKSEWHGKPNVILLLDGYNEVPTDKRFDVDGSIDDWSERKGVQIVTTSRFNASFNNKCFKRIRLLELDRATVASFLSSNGMELPEETSKIWDVINTPLMLKIYVEVGNIANDANRAYLPFKPSDRAGNLIWNYLLKELDKCIGNRGSYEAIEYATAILLVASYVCWKMERGYRFTIDVDEFEEYINEGVSFWLDNPCPRYFLRIEGKLHSYLKKCDLYELADDIKDVLENITTVFNGAREGLDTTRYSLMHQNFRDCLAAVHLNNIALASNGSLPDEFKDSLSEYVVDYLADIMVDDVIQILWEGNRKYQPTHIVATHNMLRLMYKKYDGSLAGLDWSGMDLRGVNLFNYRKGLRFDLSKKPECFVKTRISAKCFKPKGHMGSVKCVVYSPDGHRIASCSDDWTICIWDAETHQQIGDLLEGHEGVVNSIAYSPDGSRIASCSDDGTIRIWDAETHQQIGEPLKGHKGVVNSIAYSPDGSRIASCSDDRTIRVWDVETHQQIGGSLKGHRMSVKCIAYSPDGCRIASGSDDRKICIWDAKTQRQIRKLLVGHERAINSIAYSPDGSRIVSCSRDRTIRIWDTETHQQIGEPLEGHEGDITSISYSPDGCRIASCSRDRTVSIWDVETHRQIGGSLEVYGFVNSIAYSPDGYHIAGGSRGRTIRVWDAETHRQIGEPLEGHKRGVKCIAYSPDGCQIVGGSKDGTIRIWNAETHRQIGEPLEGHKRGVECIAYSLDGHRIASSSKDGTICIWNAETHQQIGEPLEGHGGWVRSMAYSPDGRQIASSGSWNKTIRIWDAETHQQIGELLKVCRGWVRSIVYSPDGRCIASGSDDRMIRIWDAEMRQQIGEPLEGHSGSVSSIAYSPDGGRIASGSVDMSVRIWDVETHLQIGRPLKGHTDEVTSVAYSLDGRFIVSGDRCGTIRIWDVETYQQIGEPLGGHDEVVRCIIYSPNGLRIASCSDDGTVKFWDAKTYRCIDTIEPLIGLNTSFTINIPIPWQVVIKRVPADFDKGIVLLRFLLSEAKSGNR